jgi:2-amino-4-hydroxy-6-hydroxymethyldihydropteridine diphosphokinase
MTHRAVLITGSNLGDRGAALDAARELLGRAAGRVVASSQVYGSEPWGDMEAGAAGFLNQVLVLETELGPEQLLDVTQEVERTLGRTAKGAMPHGRRKYASRTIDIDILYYDDLEIRTARLVVPHPLIARREFVLVPLAALLPDHKDPITGLTAQQMLDELSCGAK